MKQFSKKTDLTVLIITSAAFALSAALILFSAEIFTFIQYVVESKILHRALNPELIYRKVSPVITFPVFAVIVFDALFFVKFSAKSKIILLAQFCLAALVLTAAACFLKTPQFMNSDMASEIMLAKECFTHKTFWPRSWYDSMAFAVDCKSAFCIYFKLADGQGAFRSHFMSCAAVFAPVFAEYAES